MSKLATPTPASAIRSDMSHVIDDATSAIHDTYDETTSMLDTTVPLGEFLMNLLGLERLKMLNLIIPMKLMMKNHLLFPRVIYLIKMLL